MKWSDVPVAAKWTVGSVSTLAAAVVWLFATFHTDTRADELWAQHNQAITCRTVYGLQRDIRALTERLKFDAKLTPDQRSWIDQQIRNLQAEVRRLDPNGVC